MPQLDINTFIFQYVSLILLFVCVYTILAYIVLPLTLRASLVRARVSDLLLSSSMSTTPSARLRAARINALLNNASTLNLLLNNFSNIQNTSDSSIVAKTVYNNKTLVHVNFSYLDYLNALCVVELNMNND